MNTIQPQDPLRQQALLRARQLGELSATRAAAGPPQAPGAPATTPLNPAGVPWGWPELLARLQRRRVSERAAERLRTEEFVRAGP
jgi:hypothetical protein